jgi:two-component system response regulator RegA
VTGKRLWLSAFGGNRIPGVGCWQKHTQTEKYVEMLRSMVPAEARPSILVVDDNDPFRERLARALADRGYDVRTAANGEEAVFEARQDSPEMAIVDLRMPDRTGLEVLKDLLQIDPSTRAIILTGYGNIATAVTAMRIGAIGFLPKPVDADEVLAAFARGTDNSPEPTSETVHAPSLARAEWEHIHRVLDDCGGNVSEAARRLGIHRRSLQRKLHKLAP